MATTDSAPVHEFDWLSDIPDMLSVYAVFAGIVQGLFLQDTYYVNKWLQVSDCIWICIFTYTVSKNSM